MCMSQPSLPQPQTAPFVPPPPAPPPASATAASVQTSAPVAAAPKPRVRNPFRTDQGTGSTDSVATGLNIPV